MIYRIRHEAHHRTGMDWPIYMYTTPTPRGAVEMITIVFVLNWRPMSSILLVTLKLIAFGLPEQRPHQYEFARLNLNHVTSKRRPRLS